MNKVKMNNELSELIKKRDSLRQRIEAIEQDYKSGLSADSEEQAIQLENAEVLEGIAKAAADELNQIDERISELNKKLKS